jgi:YVTN family beta-propeller protein
MLKRVGLIWDACILLILVLNPPSFSQTDSVIATIWLPDKLSGVVHPRAFTYNPVTDKIYVCGGRRVLVIDGATDQKIAGITVGEDTWALACDTFHNKVYCANRGSDNVTVIDGRGDSVITTVKAGDEPVSLAYNYINDKIYCANDRGNNVTVLDGAGDSVLATLGVMGQPDLLTYNSTRNKMYCFARLAFCYQWTNGPGHRYDADGSSESVYLRSRS